MKRASLLVLLMLLTFSSSVHSDTTEIDLEEILRDVQAEEDSIRFDSVLQRANIIDSLHDNLSTLYDELVLYSKTSPETAMLIFAANVRHGASLISHIREEHRQFVRLSHIALRARRVSDCDKDISWSILTRAVRAHEIAEIDYEDAKSIIPSLQVAIPLMENSAIIQVSREITSKYAEALELIGTLLDEKL